MNEYNLLIGLIAFIVGFAIAFWVKGLIVSQKVKAAEKETSRILKNAKLRSETLIKEAKLDVKDRLFKMKSEFDAETKDTRSELKNRERRLMQKEENIDRKVEQFERREREILRKEKKVIQKEEKIERKEKQYQALLEEQKRQLEKISGLTAEQAKEIGLITEFYPDEQLEDEVLRLAQRLALGPTLAYARTKELLNNYISGSSLDHHLNMELKFQKEMARSKDFREGINAFLEKRIPQFEGK